MTEPFNPLDYENNFANENTEGDIDDEENTNDHFDDLERDE